MRGLDEKSSIFIHLQEGGKLHCVLERVKEDKSLFLGIRHNEVHVYYKGGRLLQISHSRPKNTFSFKFDPNYEKGLNKQISANLPPKVTLPEEAAKWITAFDNLKKLIDHENQEGNKSAAPRKAKREKVAQQQIILNNNTSGGKYFITDMEYTMPGVAFGRFDLIALKMGQGADKKHSLALIELKHGTGAFGGSPIKPDHESKAEKDADGNKVDNYGNIFSYGSGIVGHAYNFYRFIFGVNKKNEEEKESVLFDKETYNTLDYLRHETVRIIKNYCDFQLIDGENKKSLENIKLEDIDISENSVETLFLCLAVGSEETAKTTLIKYLGVMEKDNAKYNVKKCVDPGPIREERKMTLKFFVTTNDAESITDLAHCQFETLN